jgi:hypothetical protein
MGASIGLVLISAACAGASEIASGAPPSVRFAALPKKALAGESVTVAVSGPLPKDVCSLSVRYAGGVQQAGLRALRVGTGRPTWKWRVPPMTRPGAARLSVSCKAAGNTSGVLAVQELPLKIVALKQGFSIRGSDVSYGLVLANPSANEDAEDVTVLVNFVTAENVLLGSETSRVDSIPSRSEYNLGDSTSIDGSSRIARLEVVIEVGERQPALRKPVPSIKNIRIVPDSRDATWVDEIVADMTNVSSRFALRRANLSVVVFNAAGEVQGGGSGASRGSLPPHARTFVEVRNGLDAIKMADAASVHFTIEPTYESD